MRAERPKSERITRGRVGMSYVDHGREAYYFVKDKSGKITWYTEGAMALTAWERAGGHEGASLFCGRKPNNMMRVR